MSPNSKQAAVIVNRDEGATSALNDLYDEVTVNDLCDGSGVMLEEATTASTGAREGDTMMPDTEEARTGRPPQLQSQQQTTQCQQPIWQRKRFLVIVALIAVLLLIAVITGIVLGTSSSKKNQAGKNIEDEQYDGGQKDGDGDKEIIEGQEDTFESSSSSGDASPAPTTPSPSQFTTVECPVNSVPFTIQHDVQHEYQHGNSANIKQQRQQYTWSIHEGCTKKVILQCPPCPSSLNGDTNKVQVDQLVDSAERANSNNGDGSGIANLKDDGTNNNHNLFQIGYRADNEILSRACLSLDNEYILQIKPMDDASTNESTNCCGFSLPSWGSESSSYFTATFDDEMVLAMGKVCESLPKKVCKNTLGCRYKNVHGTCAALTVHGTISSNNRGGNNNRDNRDNRDNEDDDAKAVSFCQGLNRNKCRQTIHCTYNKDADRCDESGMLPGGKWNIYFGEQNNECDDDEEEFIELAKSAAPVMFGVSSLKPTNGNSWAPSASPTLRPSGTTIGNGVPMQQTTPPDVPPVPTDRPTSTPSNKPVLFSDESPSKQPTKSPTPQPTENIPIIDISCPPVASPNFVSLTPNTRVRIQRPPTNVYCGIFIEKGGEGGSLIPYARSYNGNDWEASPGPYASPSSGIDCGTSSSSGGEGLFSGDECVIYLPSLTATNGNTYNTRNDANLNDRYVILSKDGTMSTDKQIARFLEMTTFGPKKDEITALLNSGDWGPIARAKYIRNQMDMNATSHREYYRRRANAKYDALTSTARSTHPCSPNSLWRKYSFIDKDVYNRDGTHTITTFETVEEESGFVTKVYEADSWEDASDCLKCNFESALTDEDISGYSGSGFYKFGNIRDYIEWSVIVDSPGEYPISFRYSVGRQSNDGLRPLSIYVNGALIKRRYGFGYTGGWNDWVYSDLINVSLKQWKNTIRLVLEDDKGPYIDHLRVGKPPAVLIKSNGLSRTIARDGVGLMKSWKPDFTEDSSSMWFPRSPEPPSGSIFLGRPGRTVLSYTGDLEQMALDIGNPPVDFGGYEQYIPGPYFTFTDQDVFEGTASQLNRYPMLADQELLLRGGSTDPICDSLPLFADENDPPIFGVLPNGEWVLWTPQLLLEQNGPDINSDPDDMARYTSQDGGGSTRAQSGGIVSCSNVPRSFLNEPTCFLSTEESACTPTKTDVDTEITLSTSNIIAINDLSDRYVYAIRGLALEDLNMHPCLTTRSRWTIEEGACTGELTQGLATQTKSTLKAAFRRSSAYNNINNIRDIRLRPDDSCDPNDITKEKIRMRFQMQGNCITNVHPNHLDVYDFTDWVAKHPGGKYHIKKWASISEGNEGWHLDFPHDGDSVRGIPEHPMDFWETNSNTNDRDANIVHVGTLDGKLSYIDLPGALKTEAIGEHFGIQETPMPEGGTVVCGSLGEVSNSPSLGEVFDVVTDLESTSCDECINNHKHVVWTEISLYAFDQLRQRFAHALAQMIPVVPNDIRQSEKNERVAAFYDIFTRNAFGNYFNVLKEISFSPIMAEQLSYLESKSHSYVYERKDQMISRADENFAREIMQLFSIGLIQLNQDGTHKLDSTTGKPLETYTNEDIESLARAWTGFDRSPARGNIEGGSSQSDLDPLQINPLWRDPFPKSDLNGGFIGDRYPLCQDLVANKSFLRKGAQYRLLGGNASPELMTDPGEFADGATYSILRAELDPSSQLYQRLLNNGNPRLVVELEEDLDCLGIECRVDTLRVVKVSTFYYEYVERPCIQLAFYEGGKMIQGRDSFRKFGRQCANPSLTHARESCCRQERYDEVKTAKMESGVTYLYEAERMTYDTAMNRCVDYGKDLCVFRSVSVSPSDDGFRKGYHWTNQDCTVSIKVNSDGQVAVVHDIDRLKEDTTPYHLDSTHTLNWFNVFWDGDYPGSSEENSCSHNKCLRLSDGSCSCQITVVESTAVTGVDVRSISKMDVMSQLFIGALGPSTGSVPIPGEDGITTHLVGGLLDETTVFELEDKGRTLYLKNILSTVRLGKRWDMPPIVLEAEDASLVNATVGSKSGYGTFVELDSNESHIEWSVAIENNEKPHLVSFRYSLQASPTPMRIFVNGKEVIRVAKNPTIEVFGSGQSPTSVNSPLQRCEGSCGKGSLNNCLSGLFCVIRNKSDPDREVPGCHAGDADKLNYCADSDDYTHGIVFNPSGSGASDWLYTEPIRVTLVQGENTIRVEVPPGQTLAPHIDHLKIEVDSSVSDITSSTPAPSFRNPPHFMSLIAGSRSAPGEQTLRDALYETDAVLGHYFYHENVAPFLCTRIIQRFGISNASPRYVSECTNAFRTGYYEAGKESFGDGKYGSLSAMLAAITLDNEATDPTLAVDPSFGSVREPILKVLSLMRSMEYKTSVQGSSNGPPVAKDYKVKLWQMDEKIGQMAFQSPTIFSFFLPEFLTDTGPTVSAGLTSPESGLVTMPNTLGLLSGMYSLIKNGLSNCEGGFSTNPGLSGCGKDKAYGRLLYQPVGSTLFEEAADLALLLTAGRLNDNNLALIVDACSSQPEKERRIECMQQLMISTGEFHSTNFATHNGRDRSTATKLVNSQEPYKAIVYFYMSGGVDSFNLLAPYSCAPIDVHKRYRKIRGKTDEEDGVGLPLGRLLEVPGNNPAQPCSSFGIHEDFPLLRDLWQNTLFVAGAGLLDKPTTKINHKEIPVQLFSHNTMSFETKKDDVANTVIGAGVGGRIADVLRMAGIPTDTFSIKDQQVLLSGEAGGPSQYVLDKNGVPAFNEEPSIENMNDLIKALNKETTPASGFFSETYSSKLSDTIDKHQTLREILNKVKTSTNFPDSTISDQLRIVSQLMQTATSRGVKRDIFYVQDGGYDTHNNVDERLSIRFSTVNDALEAFVKELKVLNLWESTVILQFSEFGRTLAPNTNDGTDHAWAGHHFMLGGSVSGGKVLGKYPNDFEQSSSNNIALSRGRMIPVFPWDAMWKGTAEWIGVLSSDMDKVLPMHQNFPPDLLYDEDDLFMN